MSATKGERDNSDDGTISSSTQQDVQATVVNPSFRYEVNGRLVPENEDRRMDVTSTMLNSNSEHHTAAASAGVAQLASLQGSMNSNAASTGNHTLRVVSNVVPGQFQNQAGMTGMQNPLQNTHSTLMQALNSQQQQQQFRGLPPYAFASTLATSAHLQQNSLHLDSLAGLLASTVPSLVTTAPPSLSAMSTAPSTWGGETQGLNMGYLHHLILPPPLGPGNPLWGLPSAATSAQASPAARGFYESPPPATSQSSSASAFIMPTNRPPSVLYTDLDDHVLNEYQCLLRKQIELFENGVDDVKGKAQGRNNPIVVGQVGIRCRHCVGLPKSARAKGAVYYSRSLPGMYQVAQVMAKAHFGPGGCKRVPADVRERLAELKLSRKKPSGGKEYWVHCLTVVGVYEDAHQTLRFRPLDQLSQQPQLQQPR
jgi:hypothetical protein